MKKIFLVFIAGMTLLSCGTTDTKSTDVKQDSLTGMTRDSLGRPMPTESEFQNMVKDSAGTASIQWLDSTFVDLGTAKEGKKVEISYRFKNTGSTPLVISDVQAGCGCTVPERPEKPILPGETSAIKAVFDSQGRPGRSDKQITVVANTYPSNIVLRFVIEVVK